MHAARPPVLVIQHEDIVPLRMLGDWLQAAGARMVTVRPDQGEPLPRGAELAAYAAVVVLGGTMDSWDDAGHPWFPEVRDLLREVGAAGPPTLAVCLGHQLAAQAYGGEADRNPVGPTAGVVPVGWHDAAYADPLLGGIAAHPGAIAVHHNSDIATALPAGAVPLASAPDGSPQAVRFAPALWGVQFHPEADAALVEAWEEASAKKAESVHESSRAVVAGVAEAEARLVEVWQPLGERLLAATRPEAAP